MANTVLVVDDEVAITILLREWLEPAGYEVITALDGMSAWQVFFARRPNLAIVDIMMPGMSGLELCRRIREVSSLPIIILSARGAELDKVQGLEAGADDYLVKPLGEKEFLARVKAALRRAQMPPPTATAPVYSDSYLTIDYAKHQVFAQDAAIHLTPLEFRMLSYLVQNPNQVLTQEQILSQVWGEEYESPESIKWYIASIRKKIRDAPEAPKFIINVRGSGYYYQKPV